MTTDNDALARMPIALARVQRAENLFYAGWLFNLVVLGILVWLVDESWWAVAFFASMACMGIAGLVKAKVYKCWMDAE